VSARLPQRAKRDPLHSIGDPPYGEIADLNPERPNYSDGPPAGDAGAEGGEIHPPLAGQAGGIRSEALLR